MGGRPPDFVALPSGCAFHPRCPQARDRCAVDTPPLTERTTGCAACWVPPREWHS
ncbi:MAG: oligopeptide/dipeptide ABC transporter ATP-binding protein [Nocardioidaceae bacterium]